MSWLCPLETRSLLTQGPVSWLLWGVLGQDEPSVKPHLFCSEAPSSNQKQGSAPISSPTINLPHWSRHRPTGQSWPGLSLLKACPWLPRASNSWPGHLRPFLMFPTCCPGQLHHLPSSRPLATPRFGELFLHQLLSFYLPFRSPLPLPPPPGSLPGPQVELFPLQSSHRAGFSGVRNCLFRW